MHGISSGSNPDASTAKGIRSRMRSMPERKVWCASSRVRRGGAAFNRNGAHGTPYVWRVIRVNMAGD
jgi:hypothetical protein